MQLVDSCGDHARGILGRATIAGMVGRVTSSAAQPLAELPSWVTLVRAPNPGPMTLDGTNTWVLRAPGADAAWWSTRARSTRTTSRRSPAPGPVAAVLLTHGHPDHRDGLARFLRADRRAGSSTGRTRSPHGVRVRRLADARAHERLGVLRGRAATASGSSSPATRSWAGARPSSPTRTATWASTWPACAGWSSWARCRCCRGTARRCRTAPRPPRFYLEHRLARLEQVRAARAAGARTPERGRRGRLRRRGPRRCGRPPTSSVRAQLAYLERGPDSGLDAGACGNRPGPPRLDSA